MKRYILILTIIMALIFGKNVSALEIQGGREYNITSGWIASDNESAKVNGSLQNADFIINNLNADLYYTNLYLVFNQAVPANSILHLTATINVYTDQATGNPGIQYQGFDLGGFTILHDSCTQPNTNLVYRSAGGTMMQLVCDILAFTNQDTTTSRSQLNNRIFRITGPSPIQANLQAQLIFSDLRSRKINFNGLTEDDRTWLESVMPSGSSTADIESAIESAREDEKEEYEQQQEEVDSGADDAGKEADQATSNLIDTASSIIEVIRDTPATNCNIRIQTNNFDTGNINLCDKVPQAVRTTISAIIVIPVTLGALHIAYSLVMLYLNTVRKEQE